jgi:hypothetical protein
MLFALAVAACSEERMLPDATPSNKDAEVADVYDAGVRSLCPQGGAPQCMRASDCGMQDRTDEDCPGCSPWNHGMCVNGTCETKPRLMGGDVYTLIAQVPSSLQPQSFTGHILATTTSGGATITCQDVYAETFALPEPCYNTIDVRRYGKTAQTGDVYRLPFTQFVSGVTALFVIHGFDQEGTMGNRIGVACSQYDIGEPGSGTKDVPGDMMRRL